MRVLTTTPATRSLGSAIATTHADLGRIYDHNDRITPYVFLTLTADHTFVFHEEDAAAIACAILAITHTTH